MYVCISPALATLPRQRRASKNCSAMAHLKEMQHKLKVQLPLPRISLSCLAQATPQIPQVLPVKVVHALVIHPRQGLTGWQMLACASDTALGSLNAKSTHCRAANSLCESKNLYQPSSTSRAMAGSEVRTTVEAVVLTGIAS